MHYMASKGSFPSKSNPNEALDFYLQSCSVEVDCEDLAILAATFANLGVCPITKEYFIYIQI